MRAVERSSGLRRSTGKSRDDDAQEKPFIIKTGGKQNRRGVNSECRNGFRAERQETVRTTVLHQTSRPERTHRLMLARAVAARRGAALVGRTELGEYRGSALRL